MTVIGNPATMGKMGIPIYLTVSVTTGAVVTATNGSKTVSGTSTSGSCTLKLPEAGTWTVSATLSGNSSSTKTIIVKNNYSISLFFVSSTLNDNSWSTISTVSSAGEAANYWSIGDTKAVTLNGNVGDFSFSNYTTYCFIIGFNHNSTYEGTNLIHFQFGKTALTNGIDICFIDSQYANSISRTGFFNMNYTTYSNSGGWEESHMRNDICGTSLTSYSGTFIGVLPSALRSVLKSVTKYSNNTGMASDGLEDITATTDYIFLISEYEAKGVTKYSAEVEANRQSQYAYYAAGNSAGKKRHSNTGSNATYWTRSCYSYDNNSFTYIPNSGNPGIESGTYSRGLAPCFCV